MEGYQIVAQSLANNGVKYMFGVVGIPVVEVAIAAQRSSSSHIFTNPEFLQGRCFLLRSKKPM